jgi:hypothetical protein
VGNRLTVEELALAETFLQAFVEDESQAREEVGLVHSRALHGLLYLFVTIAELLESIGLKRGILP